MDYGRSSAAARVPAARGHLAPFREGAGPWLVLGRNAIPVVGVHALGWSTPFAVLEIWFDGVASLAIMLAFATWAVVRDDPEAFTPPPGVPRLPPVVVAPLFWLFPFLILGIPYWFTFGAFHARLFDEGFWEGVWSDQRSLLVALGLAFAGNLLEHARRGISRMSDSELRREGQWQIHMHLARVMVILVVLFWFPLAGIAILALALSYVEIYPLRTLRLLGLAETLDADARRGRD